MSITGLAIIYIIIWWIIFFAILPIDVERNKLIKIEGEIVNISNTFALNNKKQKQNLIDAIKIGCRKFTKEKTGKKPFTNINIVKI